jgi:hypothetical protein
VILYVPLVRERILRIGSKRLLAQGTFPTSQERFYRMNKGVDNNVKQPISAFMKGEIDMGTLALWTKAWLLFCRNKLFMLVDFFYNIHALPPLYRGEMGRRMKFPNVRSSCPEFFMFRKNLTKLVLVKTGNWEVNRR